MSKCFITGYEIEQCATFDFPRTVLLTMEC